MTHSQDHWIDSNEHTITEPRAMRSMMKEAQSANQADIEMLNGAIELENAAVKAYSDAFALNLLSMPVLEVAKGFKSDHEAHSAKEPRPYSGFIN